MNNLALPNKLTIARIIAVPVFILSVIAKNNALAISIFIFCISTDFLDGLIARRFRQRTTLGAFLDPIADKFLLLSAFITLAALQKIPLWLPIVVITKDIIIFLGWWLRLHITGNSIVSPTLLGKSSTVLEMAVIFFVIINGSRAIVSVATYLMFFSIIISTLNYIFAGVREMEKN